MKNNTAINILYLLKRNAKERIRTHVVKNSVGTNRWILISIHQNLKVGGRFWNMGDNPPKRQPKQSHLEAAARIMDDLEYLDIEYNVACDKKGMPKQIIIDIRGKNSRFRHLNY